MLDMVLFDPNMTVFVQLHNNFQKDPMEVEEVFDTINELKHFGTISN